VTEVLAFISSTSKKSPWKLQRGRCDNSFCNCDIRTKRVQCSCLVVHNSLQRDYAITVPLNIHAMALKDRGCRTDERLCNCRVHHINSLFTTIAFLPSATPWGMERHNFNSYAFIDAYTGVFMYWSRSSQDFKGFLDP
jgi:hypothetical protein